MDLWKIKTNDHDVELLAGKARISKTGELTLETASEQVRFDSQSWQSAKTVDTKTLNVMQWRNPGIDQGE